MCTALFCTDGLMKPHSSIWVVKRLHGMQADPVLRCLDDPKGLNNGHLHSGHDPQVHELANGLRLGTVVLSQDLSGAWVTICG
jgi:hypothetical protein